MKPKFFEVLDQALTIQDLESIQDLFTIRELVTPNLEILFTEDSEELEEVTRTLTRLDLNYKCLREGEKLIITLVNFLGKDVSPFIKLFAYLESMSHPSAHYEQGEECKNLLSYLSEYEFLRVRNVAYTNVEVRDILLGNTDDKYVTEEMLKSYVAR